MSEKEKKQLPEGGSIVGPGHPDYEEVDPEGPAVVIGEGFLSPETREAMEKGVKRREKEDKTRRVHKKDKERKKAQKGKRRQ